MSSGQNTSTTSRGIVLLGFTFTQVRLKAPKVSVRFRRRIMVRIKISTVCLHLSRYITWGVKIVTKNWFPSRSYVCCFMFQ